MAEGPEASGEHGAPRVDKVLPLNLRRLTAVLLKRIARQIDLPTTAALKEQRRMIKGMLTERGEDPMEIQVALTETETGTDIALRSETGVFLTIEPDHEERTEEAVNTEEEGVIVPETRREADADEETTVREDPLVITLRRNKEQLTAQNADLEEQKSKLQRELTEAKIKHRELWRSNCAQMRQVDALLAEKEDEIVEL